MIERHPQISVILPVYNAETTLFFSIGSIINQTFSDFELIVLDDGSVDRSLEIARDFNDRRIKIYTDGVNKGLTYRLNQGVALSRGSYIARMDSDDISFPERLEKQLEFLKSNPSVDLVSSMVITFDKGYQLGKTLRYEQFHEGIISKPWDCILMPHPSWMGKTSWFKANEYKIPEVLRAEDQELLMRASYSSTFYSIPEILLAYRQSNISMKKKFIARSSLLKSQVNFLFNANQYLSCLKALILFFIKLSFDALEYCFGFDRSILQKKQCVPERIDEKFRSLIIEINNGTQSKL